MTRLVLLADDPAKDHTELHRGVCPEECPALPLTGALWALTGHCPAVPPFPPYHIGNLVGTVSEPLPPLTAALAG